MKTSKFSEQQIAFIPRQADEGTTVEEVCRKAEISVQTAQQILWVDGVENEAIEASRGRERPAEASGRQSSPGQ